MDQAIVLKVSLFSMEIFVHFSTKTFLICSLSLDNTAADMFLYI